MARFIPKKQTLTEAIVSKTLVEVEENPLQTLPLDVSYDEQFLQAVMGAISSEVSATTEYDQILQIAPKVSKKELADKITPVIEDIKNEEIKHLAQLNTLISELPELKDAYDAGVKEVETGKEQPVENKEEVKESVPENRTYNGYAVGQIIGNYLNLNERQFEIVDELFPDDELEAWQVDDALQRIARNFALDSTVLDEIENQIIASRSPTLDRQDDFKSDIESDISMIENLLDQVYSVAAKERLYEVISSLRALEHDGSKDTGWRQEHSIIGGKNPTKRIIA